MRPSLLLLPAQKILSGSAKDTDINEANRAHYVAALKDGSAENGSDWMQSYFFGIGNAVQQGGAKLVGQMAYPFLSDENRQKIINAGMVPPEGGTPLPANAPLAARALHGFSEGISPISAPVGAYYTLPASFVSPIINPAVEGASKELPSGYASVPADLINVVTTALGAAGLHYSEPIIRATAEKLKIDPAAVTPEHVDQVIAEGSKDLYPAGKDFESLSSVTGIKTDDLHNVYEKTGRRPEQIFEDMQRDPTIAEDIGAGKIPVAYDYLIDKRPPIPEDIQKIMDNFKPEEKAQLSKEGETTSANPLAKIFNPAGMSESAKDMATVLRQGRGPENRDIAVIQDALQEHAKTFSNMNDDDRLGFINYMENRSGGAKLANPELQKVADKIRDIYSQVGQKIQERFPDVGLRKDYFTHQYEDEAAAKQFFSDWAAKQGSERSLQQRAFPTLSEAMEAGLKPKTTNPIETVMGYVNNMGNLMAAHRSIELAQENGIADYFKPGQQPEGWVPLNGNLAEREGKTLFAPEDAARVYNNDISKGATGLAGEILDNIQRMNNFANKLVLGMSGYHFTATTMASMASDVGRALNGGDISDIGKAITPLSSVKRGGEYINAYLGREDLSPELQKTLDLAVKNNTISVKQQDYWKAGPAKDYIDVFKNGSVGAEIKAAGEAIKQKPLTGTVGVIAKEIGRTMDTVAKPLFDYYIPRIKIAANIDELHDWMQNHPDATPEMQDRAAQEIGNSIDNRFGEMMRDNLFWHAITKQTLQTALLSYSWVTGAARMLKGIPDAGQFIMRQKELSSSAHYLFGMAATYAVVNGARTWIGTGHPPDEIMDFIYPRTGGTTPQGKEERELLPSHIGQYTNYLHEGMGELGNEMSPGLKLIYHLTANKDWRGLPITNENNGWFNEQRWGDYIKYTLGEETPIGIKNFLQGNKKGSKIGLIEKALGARQAPRFITDPEGYESMMKHINDNEYKKKVRSDKKMAEQYEGSEEGENP